ncbi:hypothetical protein Mal4_49720 [Maioricimonas rarisocia]|uniref:DoxX n=1 Tax=Maioricimonas rarisocia TaxID=2528026 RepID=A0A517ZDR8_9PLAN|nr:DoxX family membrane protein [Maioricimonas rarisocia]QDU40614.1 hypothetical protein Mal4_49720 [Maioricimonas rarisocia]
MVNRRHDDLSSVYVPLRLTYGLVPVVAGLDKFTNLLTDWSAYLPPLAADLLPVAPDAFMGVVGIIEVLAGLAVLTKWPRLGAYVVASWLTLIALTLIPGGHFDVAVRDLVMAVGAVCLGQLAALRGEPLWPTRHASEEMGLHASAN